MICSTFSVVVGPAAAASALACQCETRRTTSVPYMAEKITAHVVYVVPTSNIEVTLLSRRPRIFVFLSTNSNAPQGALNRRSRSTWYSAWLAVLPWLRACKDDIPSQSLGRQSHDIDACPMIPNRYPSYQLQSTAATSDELEPYGLGPGRGAFKTRILGCWCMNNRVCGWPFACMLWVVRA